MQRAQRESSSAICKSHLDMGNAHGAREACHMRAQIAFYRRGGDEGNSEIVVVYSPLIGYAGF